MYLIQQHAIPPLCNLLHLNDIKVVTVALEGLENMLRVCSTMGRLNYMVDILAECNGIGKSLSPFPSPSFSRVFGLKSRVFHMYIFLIGAIENLQSHNNKTIYDRAVKILETYLGAEEVGESEIVPDVVMGAGGHQQFGFGQGPQGGAGSNGAAPGGFQF